MIWLFAALTVLAGALIPLQAGINASLRSHLGHPILAALTNFAVGGAMLVLFALATRVSLPTLGQLQSAPWWCWLGGTMGAALVVTGVLFSLKLGAATFVACIILGQLTSSVILDHIGAAGYIEHAVNPMRLLGLLLLALGAYFVRAF